MADKQPSFQYSHSWSSLGPSNGPTRISPALPKGLEHIKWSDQGWFIFNWVTKNQANLAHVGLVGQLASTTLFCIFQ